MYSVPRTTLTDHITGKSERFKPGIPAMLTEDEEIALVDYIKYMASINMPLRRNDIRSTILVSIVTLMHTTEFKSFTLT